MKKFLLITILLVSSIQAFSQPLALKKFLDTPFIHEFDSLRMRAERSVSDFKALQHLYSEEEVQVVMDAYDAAAGMFNNALYNIKSDFQIKDKRKFIRKYPEDYSKQMMADLLAAKEVYEDYKYEVTTLTEGRVTGFAWLIPVITIFQQARNGFQIFKQLKDKWDAFNEKILDQYLIERYQFKLWNEIP